MRNGLASRARWSLLAWALASCTSAAGSRLPAELDAQVELSMRDASSEADSSATDPSLTRVSESDADPLDAAHDVVTEPDAAVAQVCTTVEPSACPTPATRYADVQPIFEQRCVGCHSPLWTGPWPLDEYQYVADWQDDVRTDLLNCSMPPADAGVTITSEERVKILSFLRCGLPM